MRSSLKVWSLMLGVIHKWYPLWMAPLHKIHVTFTLTPYIVFNKVVALQLLTKYAMASNIFVKDIYKRLPQMHASWKPPIKLQSFKIRGWSNRPGIEPRLNSLTLALTACNFTAFWPTKTHRTSGKILTLINIVSAQETGSILKISITLSKWPNLSTYIGLIY